MEDQPRVKSRRSKVVEALSILFILSTAWLVLSPTLCACGDRDRARRSSCQSNLKQIMLSVRQYARDYDTNTPILATSRAKFGWAGELQPYLKPLAVFQCPSEACGPTPGPSQAGYTDYWLNARMAGKREADLPDASRTIALGDGDSGDARSHLAAIPHRWVQDQKSPLHRHLNGANFAFADGHVKWVKADRWNNSMDSTADYTFQLQPIIKEVRK